MNLQESTRGPNGNQDIDFGTQRMEMEMEWNTYMCWIISRLRGTSLSLCQFPFIPMDDMNLCRLSDCCMPPDPMLFCICGPAGPIPGPIC